MSARTFVARPPRVLQVVLGLHPGGTERLVIDLVTRLDQDIPMMVCCLDEDGAWAGHLREHGVEVHALGRRPGFHPSLGGQIHRQIQRHRATIVHAHHYSPFVYGAIARLQSPNVRLIFTEHGRVSNTPPSPKRRLANRLLSKCAHRVFAVSNELRAHIIEEGFGKRQVGVIYNGIDVGPCPSPAARKAIRDRLGVSDDVLVIGTVARLDPVKDLGSFLQAAAVASAKIPLRVVVIGDGPLRSQLERQAADLGIGRLVTFLGHRDDAREWLAGCDVFVNCSISEGVSLTILEAMAAELPVIATAVGGTPEVVDSDCGILVAPKNVGELSGAIVAIGADRRRAAALGVAARARVEAHFTLDRMVRQYREVYEELS